MPMKDQIYWVGASYDNSDKNKIPTQRKKEWLIEKLESIITEPFKIVEHKANIRPTTVDRRPMIGSHSNFKNIYLLNGLGTRGILLAPTLSAWLYNQILRAHQFLKK